MTTTYPASRVRVDASLYKFTHGRKPRGRGTWAFRMGGGYLPSDGELWRAPSNLMYSAAKKLAQAEAGRRGLPFVNVAT